MEDQPIEIRVCDPQKIGEGLKAYVVYRVVTKTNLPCFEKKSFSVPRRFSDFHCLHGKLINRHLHQGIIVPPAPEKSVKEMVKIKMSQDETVSSDAFIVKRRAALERYLNRIASHPVLRTDSDFRDFLRIESDLPKADIVQAVLNSDVLRFFDKATLKCEKKVLGMLKEPDSWFEKKKREIWDLEQKLRKLQSSIEGIVQHRKDVAQSAERFGRSTAVLGNCEEHTSLFSCFSELAGVENKVENLQCLEANRDLYILSELLKEYVNLIDVVKYVFYQRELNYKSWQWLESEVSESRGLFLHEPDPYTRATYGRELRALQAESAIVKKEFEKFSETVRSEVETFEKYMRQEFKCAITRCLERSLAEQQKIINYWKSLLLG